MRKLETNDWMVINNIIYKIYTTEDFNEMRYELLSQLKILLNFDSADFYILSKEDGKIIDNPVTYNCDVNLSEYYEEIDKSRGIMVSGKTLIYRETDIVADEARRETDYYRKVYRPNNWDYALQMVVARNKKFLGILTFYRTIGKENFSHDDIFVLDILKDHLGFRLEQYIKRFGDNTEKYTITEAVKEYQLTKREEMVLRLLMKGKNSESISEELVITPNTLKKHILNIYRKLGIKNRVQLFKMIKEME